MLTIHQFPILKKDHFSLKMPQGAKILTVQVHYGKPQIFLLVNTKRPRETRKFRLVATGNPIEEAEELLNYIGTFHLKGIGVTCHLFEIREEQPSS